MDCGLLVPHQHVAQAGVFKQRIVDRQHCAAGIAEQSVHADFNKRIDQYFAPLRNAGIGPRTGSGRAANTGVSISDKQGFMSCRVRAFYTK